MPSFALLKFELAQIPQGHKAVPWPTLKCSNVIPQGHIFQLLSITIYSRCRKRCISGQHPPVLENLSDSHKAEEKSQSLIPPDEEIHVNLVQIPHPSWAKIKFLTLQYGAWSNALGRGWREDVEGSNINRPGPSSSKAG